MENAKSIKFEFDGQDCKVRLTYRGHTTIALIVIGKQDMTGLDRQERVYCGTSSCHPGDTYDVKMGVKQACRMALMISDYNDHCQAQDKEAVRRAGIYRAIREALKPRSRIQRAVYQIEVETVFDKLPADLQATKEK